MSQELHITIDNLLHDAERAEGGARVARRFGDVAAANELQEKSERLFAEALRLDPDKTAPAWEETSL